VPESGAEADTVDKPEATTRWERDDENNIAASIPDDDVLINPMHKRERYLAQPNDTVRVYVVKDSSRAVKEIIQSKM
jgi:hypothetical protein